MRIIREYRVDLECENDVILGRIPVLTIMVELGGVLRKIYIGLSFP